MAKEQVSEGADFSITYLDRSNLGAESNVMVVSGDDGSIAVSKPFTASAAVTLSGATTLSGAASLTGAVTASSVVATLLGAGSAQALSGAGAVNVTTLVTLYTSTGGAEALTLANGTISGQLKLVHHTVDGGSGVLTPASAGNFATVTFTNVHDWALFMWSGSAWNVVANGGATIA